MSFFIRAKTQKEKVIKPKNAKKRENKIKPGLTGSSKKRKTYDEDITSESESENDDEVLSQLSSSDDETANEKRNRLAKMMLQEIKEKLDNEDGEVTSYLKKEVLERSGKLFHEVSNLYEEPKKEDITFFHWKKLRMVTCIAISSDAKFIFSGSSDGTIVKWSVATSTKLESVFGNWKKEEREAHRMAIMALAISKDSKYLASGGKDNEIRLWHPETLKHIYTFKGHRSFVTGLSFQYGSHQLFSCSKDKSIKLWNVDELSYIETLFGHEDCITSIDCTNQERAVTSGGRDRTVRFWKIPEESHLVFHGLGGCIDCAKFVDNHHFVSVSDDNSLSLWTTERKKPIFVVKNAHIYPTDDSITDDKPLNRNPKSLTVNFNKNNNNTLSTVKKSGNFNGITSEKYGTIMINGKIETEKNNLSPGGSNVRGQCTINENIMEGLNKYDTCNGSTDEPELENEDRGTLDVVSEEKGLNVRVKERPSITSIPEGHEQQQWISSLAVLRKTNLVASGSRDGVIRFWKITTGFKSIVRLFTIKMEGFVNALNFSEDGTFLIAAIGREHKLGRWFTSIKTVKNSIALIKLTKKTINSIGGQGTIDSS